MYLHLSRASAIQLDVPTTLNFWKGDLRLHFCAIPQHEDKSMCKCQFVKGQFSSLQSLGLSDAASRVG